jgi:hypothetical protein
MTTSWEQVLVFCVNIIGAGVGVLCQHHGGRAWCLRHHWGQGLAKMVVTCHKEDNKELQPFLHQNL